MKLITYTDGGARGNPGPAACGMVIKNERGKTLESFGRYIGETTNNQAEYRALIFALERAQELGATEVACFMDSELLVKQLRREYRVRDKDLAPLFVKIWNLSTQFKKISFTHVPRERNHEADAMVNKTLDNKLARVSGS